MTTSISETHRPARFLGLPPLLSELGLLLLLPALLASCDCLSGSDEEDGNRNDSLPELLSFMTEKSDQFIVDIELLGSGNPFLGERANGPHPGAHANWHNDDVTWPAGLLPEQYPPIYAPADGYIYRVDHKYSLGAHDRYGIDLAFAREGNRPCLLCYSIEPMCLEPSPDFYRSFILVEEGEEVQKGDIIGYMYIPTNAIAHIHFHLLVEFDDTFMAPALFAQALVDSFHAHWGIFGNDLGDPIPPCMGYMVSADENPFGTGPVDILW